MSTHVQQQRVQPIFGLVDQPVQTLGGERRSNPRGERLLRTVVQTAVLRAHPRARNEDQQLKRRGAGTQPLGLAVENDDAGCLGAAPFSTRLTSSSQPTSPSLTQNAPVPVLFPQAASVQPSTACEDRGLEAIALTCYRHPLSIFPSHPSRGIHRVHHCLVGVR